MSKQQEKCDELFRIFINTIEENHFSDHSTECDDCIKKLVDGVFQIVLPTLNRRAKHILKKESPQYAELFGEYFETSKNSINEYSKKSPVKLWEDKFEPTQVPRFLHKFNEMMKKEIRSKFLTEDVDIYKEYVGRYKNALKRYYKYDKHKTLLYYEWIIETPDTDIIDILFDEISGNKQKEPKKQNGMIKYSTAVKSIERYARQLNVNFNHIQRNELINKLTENKRYKEREQLLCEIAYDGLEDSNATNKRTKKKKLEPINQLEEADVESDNSYEGSQFEFDQTYNPRVKQDNTLVFYDYSWVFPWINTFLANRGQDSAWAEEIFKYYDSPNTLIGIAKNPQITIDKFRKICWPNIRKKNTKELLAKLTTLTGDKWTEDAVKRNFEGLIFEINALSDIESLKDSNILTDLHTKE